MSDSALGLIFEIAADPSKGIAATESFRDKAGHAIKEFEDQFFSSMSKSMGLSKEFVIGMGVAAGAVAGLTIAAFEFAHKAAELGEKLYDVHEKTGLATASLSGLNAISKQNGESFDTLALSLGRAGINLEKAIIDPGGKSAQILNDVMGGAKNLAELGLKPMDDRIQVVLKRIFEMNDVGQRNLALQTLLGRGWQTNADTLQYLAREGFGSAIEAAKRFGVYWDDEAGRKAKQFTVEWQQTKMTFEAVASVLGQKLIPVMSGMMSAVLMGIEYLPQYGAILTDVVTMNKKGLDADKANWKSVNDVILDVVANVEKLASVESKSDEGPELNVDNSAAEAKAAAKAKRLAEARLDAFLNGNSQFEKASQKAGEEEIRRNEVKFEKILNMDRALEAAKTLMNKKVADQEKINDDWQMKTGQQRVDAQLRYEDLIEKGRMRGMQVWAQANEKAGEQIAKMGEKQVAAEAHAVNLRIAMLHQLGSVSNAVFAGMSQSVRRWANVVEMAVMQVITALITKNMQEQKDILTISALKGYHYAAQAVADLGDGNFWAAAKHAAAASMFFAVAATPVIGAAVAAAQSPGLSSGTESGASAAASSGPSGPVSMAPGSRRPSGTMTHIIITNDREAGAYFADRLTDHARSGGQLLATGLVR